MYTQKDEEKYITDYFKGNSKGRFLDFGAFEPFTFSNTRKLYEKGWKGIYLEPAIIKFEKFVLEYGQDKEMVLINKAVSTYDGEITFYNCNDGPSTTQVSHMEKWMDRISDWKKETVPCISINTLLDQYAREIDFLNIDVEGTNYELLKAIDPKYFRKIKMICVEHDDHVEEILDILTSNGFKAIHYNVENLIFVKGSYWKSFNLKKSLKNLHPLIELEEMKPKKKIRLKDYIPFLKYVKTQFKVFIQEEVKRQASKIMENDLGLIKRNTIQIRNLDYLYEIFEWTNSPQYDREQYSGCDDPMNVNGRRIHDMDVVLAACKNISNPGGTILEIGTAYGNMTMNMSKNAPDSNIFTINIPEEEIEEGGKNITFGIPNENIGYLYREAECQNITQILANTLNWEPEMEQIDLAFIDGCHDEDYIFQDTVKVLSKCKPGSIILWHDFNPDLVDKWHWIGDVCKGVNRLYAEGYLTKKLYHLQDSWVGIYQV